MNSPWLLSPCFGVSHMPIVSTKQNETWSSSTAQSRKNVVWLVFFIFWCWKNKWTHWMSSPGPSACGAAMILLHHVPLGYKKNLDPCFFRATATTASVGAATATAATAHRKPETWDGLKFCCFCPVIFQSHPDPPRQQLSCFITYRPAKCLEGQDKS